jgi:hypothetical protein
MDAGRAVSFQASPVSAREDSTMPEDAPIHRRTRLNPMGLHALTCAMCRRRIHPLPVREEALCEECHESLVDTLASRGIGELERLLERQAREE